jgi:hypothetical protein
MEKEEDNKDLLDDITHLTEELEAKEDELTKQKVCDLQDELQQSQLILGREQALSQQSVSILNY